MTPSGRTARVLECARKQGFDLCGIAMLEDWPELARFSEWRERGFAGEMHYLADPRRLSPQNVLPGARCVIVCAMNYQTPLPLSVEMAAESARSEIPRAWISRYAWGDDYHSVLAARLEALVKALRMEFTEDFAARAYVDTGPVAERIAARRAGLGWLAKNTCLINEGIGSWLFLGVILTNLDCGPSVASQEELPADLCGNCTLCMDACPTQALAEPCVLDARRCISYLTIELQGTIPEEFRSALGNMVFGCDICQDVCPWNRKAPATPLADFLPREFSRDDSSGATGSLFHPALEWLAALSEDEFRQLFRGSALRRAKWRGLVRNACVALGNFPMIANSETHQRILALLTKLAGSEDAIVAEHANWAIRRLKG